MMFFSSIILLFIAYLSYRFYKNWIAPSVVSSTSWGGVLLCYCLLNHGLYDISNKCLFVILLWNICLCLGSFVFHSINIFSLTTRWKQPKKFNLWVRNLFFYISLIGFIPSLYISYKQALSIGDGDLLLNLRLANTGIVKTEFSLGIWAYITSISMVSYLIELLVSKGHFNRRVIVILLVNILLGLATMSKSSFMFLFASSLVVIMSIRAVRIRKMCTYTLMLLILMVGIHEGRSSSDDSKPLERVFYTYFLGGIPALDQIVQSNMHSKIPGQNVLAIVNNVRAKITGDDSYKKEEYVFDITEKGYLFVPEPTNVYTVIGKFWLDYGYIGVIIISFLLGVISAYFYKLYCLRIGWGVILYSYFFPVLLLQFFGEYIFTNLSYLLQLIILSLFAYKFRYIFKWRRSISY